MQFTETRSEEKQPGAASPKSCCKRELSWGPPKINCVFHVAKHLFCCGCFKRRSKRVNKRPLKNEENSANKCSIHFQANGIQ